MKHITDVMAVAAAGLLASYPIGTCQGQTAPSTVPGTAPPPALPPGAANVSPPPTMPPGSIALAIRPEPAVPDISPQGIQPAQSIGPALIPPMPTPVIPPGTTPAILPPGNPAAFPELPSS